MKRAYTFLQAVLNFGATAEPDITTASTLTEKTYENPLLSHAVRFNHIKTVQKILQDMRAANSTHLAATLHTTYIKDSDGTIYNILHYCIRYDKSPTINLILELFPSEEERIHFLRREKALELAIHTHDAIARNHIELIYMLLQKMGDHLTQDEAIEVIQFYCRNFTSLTPVGLYSIYKLLDFIPDLIPNLNTLFNPEQRHKILQWIIHQTPQIGAYLTQPYHQKMHTILFEADTLPTLPLAILNILSEYLLSDPIPNLIRHFINSTPVSSKEGGLVPTIKIVRELKNYKTALNFIQKQYIRYVKSKVQIEHSTMLHLENLVSVEADCLYSGPTISFLLRNQDTTMVKQIFEQHDDYLALPQMTLHIVSIKQLKQAIYYYAIKYNNVYLKTLLKSINLEDTPYPFLYKAIQTGEKAFIDECLHNNLDFGTHSENDYNAKRTERIGHFVEPFKQEIKGILFAYALRSASLEETGLDEADLNKITTECNAANARNTVAPPVLGPHPGTPPPLIVAEPKKAIIYSAYDTACNTSTDIIIGYLLTPPKRFL